MVEWFTSLMQAIQSNPLVAGIFGTTVFAGLAVYFKNLPREIYSFLLNFLTTRIVVDQLSKNNFNLAGDIQYFDRSNNIFTFILLSIMNRKVFTFHRAKECSTTSSQDTNGILIKGISSENYKNTKFRFIPTNNIVYFTIIDHTFLTFKVHEHSNNMRRTYSLNIRFFTRNEKKIEKIVNNLIKESANAFESSCQIYYHMNSGSNWSWLLKEPQYSQNPFMLTKQQEEIYFKIARFLNSEGKYKKLCKPFHTGFIFYGKPGCGKSQFIKKISEDFGLDIYILNLNCVGTDSSLIQLLSDIPKPAIVLIEDVDRYKFFGANGTAQKIVQPTEIEDPREYPSSHDFPMSADEFFASLEADKFPGLNKGVPVTAQTGRPRGIRNIGPADFDDETCDDPMVTAMKAESMLSFSTVLNILDGIYAPDSGIIFIATTNHYDRLDPAFIRPGRFDYKYEFDYMTPDDICRFLHIQYQSDVEIKINPTVSLPISIVSNMCFENTDIRECAEKINKNYSLPEPAPIELRGENIDKS